MVETVVFVIAALVILSGALGVILARNPVHSALMLIMTLFGIAVLFVAQEAHFLAAVQAIVYAGAIVVLFLFVIMLLGVDQSEDLATEPLTGQRPAALVAGAVLGGSLVALLVASSITGARSRGAEINAREANIDQLARLLFTDYIIAFEITSILLVIAVVGAVVLARARRGTEEDTDAPDRVDPDGEAGGASRLRAERGGR